MTTLILAGWIVATYYSFKSGGPLGIVRALRSPHVPLHYKVALAACLLPIPGSLDELVAALLLARIAAMEPTKA